VHPERRRRGLGRAMMRHLLSFCHDAPSIDLAVHPDNNPICRQPPWVRFGRTRQRRTRSGCPPSPDVGRCVGRRTKTALPVIVAEPVSAPIKARATEILAGAQGRRSARQLDTMR
jgi:hypothetical protein